MPVYTLPSDRLVDWTPGTHVGVIGGIPTDRTNIIDVTQSPYNADNTGNSDASSAIQAAIDGSSVGDIIYLPAGTYLSTSTIIMNAPAHGRTLRGAGPTTIIDNRNVSYALSIGSASGYSNNGASIPDRTVTAGLAKGSTTITIGDTSVFYVNQLIMIMVESDDAVPVMSVYNYDIKTEQAPTKQVVRLVSKTSNTLTFFPPLYDDYGGGALEVRVQGSVFQSDSIGIENLTIDCSNVSAYCGLQFQNLYNSWMTNVQVIKANNYPFIMGAGLNCEMRGCFVNAGKDLGSNGAGLLFGCWACLIEDNIFYKVFPLIEGNNGSSGNVFAYNYGSTNGDITTNHSPQNRFNLYEGNCFSFMISDGYFGGEAELTAYRNYLYGSAIHMRRWSRKFSVVGNITASALGSDGYPNLGNIDFNGTAQHSLGVNWRDWKMTATLTSRIDDNNGAITLNSGELFPPDGFVTQIIMLTWSSGTINRLFAVGSVTGNVANIVNYNGTDPLPALSSSVTVGPGSYYSYPNGSYQEKDLDVAATLIDAGNYNLQLSSMSSLGGDTLADSLFRTVTPDFFTNASKSWPPYDPTDPSGADASNIPAGQRYIDSLPPTPPTITSADNAITYIGESFSFQITTDIDTDSFSADNLPAWAALNTSSGLITGMPDTIAVSNVTLHATNDTGTGDQSFTLTVDASRTAIITCSIPGIVNAPVSVGNFVLIE